MKKIYFIPLILFLNISYGLYRFYEYKEFKGDYELLNNKYIELKERLNIEIEDKNEEGYINYDDKVIKSNSFFISMIYEISNISGLKLVSTSEFVPKDSDGEYTLNYIVFRFEANMKMF